MDIATILTTVGSVAAGAAGAVGLGKVFGKRKDTTVKVEAEPAKAPELEKVLNKQRKFGANDYYWHVKLTHKGKEVDFMWSDHAVGVAESTAKKNPEDIPSE